MKTAVTFIAIALATHSLHAQNLITNGDFELLEYSAPPFFRFLPHSDSTTLPGWTAIDDFIGEPSYVFSEELYPDFIHSGSQAVFLNQGSGLSSLFSTTANTTYELSFFATPSVSGQPIGSVSPLQIAVAGFTTTFASSVADVYEHVTFQFTASTTTADAVLSFYNPSASGDYKHYAIDTVSVTVVPEPSTICLLLVSFVGLTFRRRGHDRNG